MDASVGVTENTFTNVKTSSVFNGSDGGLTGSRWGMVGTEDLGGGLKAVFKLENRLNIDAGTDTTGFTGDAYVGLSGGLGTVHLGRSYTAYDGVIALAESNMVWDSAFTPTANPTFNSRAANQVKYVSPSFSGFAVTVSSGLSEVAGTKNTNGLALAYTAGPLKVSAGGAADSNGSNSAISASYNFGVAAISGGYSTLDGINNGNDAKGYNLGVNVPMGAFNFSLAYGSSDTETNAGVEVSDISGFGAGVTYSLSKRTTLYAGYKDQDTKTAGVKTAGTRVYATGVRHDF